MTEPRDSGAEVVSDRAGRWKAVRLVSPGGGLEATFLPKLGMVGNSLRQGGEELLGQRGGPDAYAERRSTFGIPLLYPWANRLSDWEYEQAGRHVHLDHRSPVLKPDPDTGLPIHGALAACQFWDVSDTGADSAQAWLEATLDYGAHDELMSVFPFAHRVGFRAAVSEAELAVRLTITPTGTDQVPIAFGFHPYIALPGSQRDDWEIELPVRRRAILDDRGIPTGRQEDLAPGRLSGRLDARTFDDSFEVLAGDPPVFAVADGRRRLEVRYSEGYPVAQVYAPTESTFIAFEPMTAPVDALRSGLGLRLVGPGQQFVAQFSIAVARL